MSRKAITSQRVEAPELFVCNGTYQIAPVTTKVELQDDVDDWLNSIHGTLDVIIDGLHDQSGLLAANPRAIQQVLFGVVKNVEMVQGALAAIDKLGN